MKIFNSLNQIINLHINESFEIVGEVKILWNHLIIVHYKSMTSILRMRNYISRIIIEFLIMLIIIFLNRYFFKKILRITLNTFWGIISNISIKSIKDNQSNNSYKLSYRIGFNYRMFSMDNLIN